MILDKYSKKKNDFKKSLSNLKLALKTIDEKVENTEFKIAIGDADADIIDDLILEGLIQRCEIVTDLCWKILKDFLEKQGFEEDYIIAPKDVFREAFNKKIISENICNGFINHALKFRNERSHRYDVSFLDNVKDEIEGLIYIFDGIENVIDEK